MAASRGLDGFDREAFESDVIFLKLLERLRLEWVAAKSAGDKTRARTLLRLIDRLGPSTGTGQFDEFKTHIRSLQPAGLAVQNPLYEEFHTPESSVTMGHVSEKWFKLFDDSAEILLHHAELV